MKSKSKMTISCIFLFLLCLILLSFSLNKCESLTDNQLASNIASNNASYNSSENASENIDDSKKSTTEENANNKKTKTVLNGWVKKSGKKYYYINNKKVTGLKKIGKYKYYFNKKGVMQKNKMIAKNKFVNKKGRLVNKSELYEYGVNGLSGLKKKLNSQIKNYNGSYSIYVKNLDTNRYMVINNKELYPASTVKLYCMEAIYDKANKGKLKIDTTTLSLLNSMITVSSNEAYNQLVTKLGNGSLSKGLTYLTNYCKKQGYKDTVCANSLPLSSYNNMSSVKSHTSVRDLGHLIERINRNSLVNKSYSKAAKSLMLKQQRRSKIPSAIPSSASCGNKTGEIPGMDHDAAFVLSKNADYVIVVMSKGDYQAISHISSISKTVYNHFN
ncbi:MAG: serine hydrolase [Lachnospiraceae bacterium]|nr:serine hydrolase [Lachnospiraceae bacterium]